MKKFRMPDGRVIQVRKGLGDLWITAWTENGIGWHRVKSPALPPRRRSETAELDLENFARSKRLEEVPA